MQSHAARTPAPQYDYRRQGRVTGPVAVLEMDPARVHPSISVQSSWRGGYGVIRGLRERGRLVEDHVLQRGKRVSGAGRIRRGVWTIAEHRDVWQRAHPDASIVAWAGNGNLLTNPHFIGYADKTLYALGKEPLGARSYSCLVVRRDKVSIETLRAGDFGGDIECATFGQQVVTNGDPIDREQLARKASSGEFADLRHVFLFPRINLGPERWIDAGLAAFYRYNGEMDRRAIERALYAQPVTADVRQFREAEVRRALAEKGYRYYELRGGVLKFVPLPGIYPHSLVGIRRDGTLLAVAVAGLSNRTGMTIEGAGLLMAELGARDALIIDNGADVSLGVGDETLVNGRDRLRSVLFFHGAGTDLPRARHYESASFQSVRPVSVARRP